MDRGILAARRAWALEEIEEKSGLDLSREALRKAPSVEIFQLFQLEKLAEELDCKCTCRPGPTAAEIMDAIDQAKGVGPSMSVKIEGILSDLYADHPSTQA